MKTQKKYTVSFKFSGDAAAALDCYAEHDGRTRANLVRTILYAHLVRNPTALYCVAFDPNKSLHRWVAGRVSGHFLPSLDDAPPLPKPQPPAVTVRVRLEQDLAIALEYHADYTFSSPHRRAAALKAIVRSWLILCPLNFVLPTFNKSGTLRQWCFLSILAARERHDFGAVYFRGS